MGPEEDEQGSYDPMGDLNGSDSGYPEQTYDNAATEYSFNYAEPEANSSSNPPEPNVCRDDGTGAESQYPPDWQHGNPTRPVSPDPNVIEIPPSNPDDRPTIPAPPPYPYPHWPDDRPTVPAPPPASEDSTEETVTKALLVLGLSLALVPTVAAAIVDPEPASKLTLAGLTVYEIEALGAALGFAATVSR